MEAKMDFKFDRFELEKVKEQYEKEKESLPEITRTFFEVAIGLLEDTLRKQEEFELSKMQAKQAFEEAVQGKLEKIPPPQIKAKVKQSWQTIKYNKGLNIWYLPIKREDEWGEHIGNLIIFPDDRAFIVTKEHILKTAPVMISTSEK